MIGLGRQVCGDLDRAAQREWLVTDGLGGYAMGTVAGLRTRRYHGLLVVASAPPGGRRLGLAALDPVLVLGDRRVRLATHEWVGGSVDPTGHRHLESFHLEEGVPRWRYVIGDVVLEVEVAMAHGRPAVEVSCTLVRAASPVRLELSALCTWRDVHGERHAGAPLSTEALADGTVVEGAYRVRGPGFVPAGEWYLGAHWREEEARGLPCDEDLWHAGTFSAELSPGERTAVQAFAGALDEPPPEGLAAAARRRAGALCSRAGSTDEVDRLLVVAADGFVTSSPPGVVAGYPWFSAWARDTLTSYEGLFLETGRLEEGRRLLAGTVAALRGGLLVNTGDTATPETNSIDAPLWLLHAVGRHVERSGDDDLAAEVVPDLLALVGSLTGGAGHGIGIDPADGLLAGGAPGLALTWMDARVGGVPVTARAGKPVEVNALLIDGLSSLRSMCDRVGRDPGVLGALEARARTSFLRRFARPDGRGLYDVVDGPGGDDATLRPNQLLAASLRHGPLSPPAGAATAGASGASGSSDAGVLDACWPLVTSLGLRSLDPSDPRYLGLHRGDQARRDLAYHQGTVWPWLTGALVEAGLRHGRPLPGALDALVTHLGEWGLGSVSETADGDAPHAASGCPFQAWSVAELLRARRLAVT